VFVPVRSCADKGRKLKTPSIGTAIGRKEGTETETKQKDGRTETESRKGIKAERKGTAYPPSPSFLSRFPPFLPYCPYAYAKENRIPFPLVPYFLPFIPILFPFIENGLSVPFIYFTFAETKTKKKYENEKAHSEKQRFFAHCLQTKRDATCIPIWNDQ
jgi:hypothetical protein